MPAAQPSRLPTAADFARCYACGHERSHHHLQTGCKPNDGCGCRPCTGTANCSCSGFVSAELAYSRQLDRRDREREWTRDGGF